MIYVNIYINLAVRPPNLTNMTKITFLQAWIENSMTAELKKKAMRPPKKIVWTLNFVH